MNEETATGRREGYPGIMHDLNLNALKDYAKEQPNNPAAGLLVSSSRIALETQAIATEAMSVAAYCGAFFNSSQVIAPGYEYATQAYDLGIKCQQHACLVANKFADLTHALRMGCLRASLSDAARFQSDLRQMEEWRDRAKATSEEAAALIRRALNQIDIDKDGE